MAWESTIVDASFVDILRPRNPREENHQIKEGNIAKSIDRNPRVKRQKDLDGLSAKKNQERHYVSLQGNG